MTDTHIHIHTGQIRDISSDQTLHTKHLHIHVALSDTILAYGLSILWLLKNWLSQKQCICYAGVTMVGPRAGRDSQGHLGSWSMATRVEASQPVAALSLSPHSPGSQTA